MMRLEATLYSSLIFVNASNYFSFCRLYTAYNLAYLTNFFMCVNRTFTLTFDIFAYFYDHNEIIDFHFLQEWEQNHFFIFLCMQYHRTSYYINSRGTPGLFNQVVSDLFNQSMK